MSTQSAWKWFLYNADQSIIGDCQLALKKHRKTLFSWPVQTQTLPLLCLWMAHVGRAVSNQLCPLWCCDTEHSYEQQLLWTIKKHNKLQWRAAPREYFDPPTSLRAAASSRQRGENFASDLSHSEKPSVEKSSHSASLSERKLSSQQLSQPCLHQHDADTLTKAERDTNVIPVNTWRQRILLNYLTF